MTVDSSPGLDRTHGLDGGDAWWRRAVLYQIYPRSWADSDGDGVGDLPGITARLPYLRDLGVDGVWISPFYRSPMADAGYDVADYRDIDPVFGDLSDATALVARAHELDLRVLIDLVPNHSSDEHVWFQEALAAGPGSPERARYLFRDGRGAEGELAPNNWDSVFGGPAWTRVTEADGRPGQWYLHLFHPKQPDFDWDNPAVREEFHDVLRFWLDRGVDGFRVDVAHSLVKAAGLPDYDRPLHLLEGGGSPDRVALPDDLRPPMFDQDGVHEVYRGWRKVLDEYNPRADPDADRILCAEAWVKPAERAVRYVRADEMHQMFNFDFLQTPWVAAEYRAVVDATYDACGSVGAPPTWVLSNHDVVRVVTRLGMPRGTRLPAGIGVDDPQPDLDLGTRRARAAAMVTLALPGAAYVYAGDELGLPDHTTMPDDRRHDPIWERSGHTDRGRDGCRSPFPWVGDAPSYGFGPTDRSWLPQPDSFAGLAVDRQDGVPGSTLELYRTLLRLRREHRLGTGDLAWLPGYGEDVVAFVVTGAQGARVAVVANLGEEPVPLPAGAQVLAASAEPRDGALPPDVAVWLAP